jgi:hypothetical protein
MNFGQGGASNTFIMNRFIEVNNNLNLNETDYVIVMFTNMDRFSFRNKNNWYHGGNIYFNPNISNEFLENMWSSEWSVYQSFIAIKTIKEILTLKNIKHTFLTSMNNNALSNEYKNNKLMKHYFDSIYDMLDVKKSMDDWRRENYPNQLEYVKYGDQNEYDTHPTQTMHYRYLTETFPEYDTLKSKQRYELSLKAVNNKSTKLQHEIYSKIILEPFNKAFWLGPKLFY